MAEKLQEYSLTWEVTDEMTAKRIGSAGSQILSTPNMVALMEAAALELAKSYLEEGQTTVGAEIHCRHLAPTPVGMKVTATAKLRSIERRKMWFDIEVNDEKGKCGEGSHLRIMVNSKAMSDKAASKAELGVSGLSIMHGFCCSGIRGSGKISLWYAMRVNRDKEKLLVTCVCSNIEREAAVRTETIGWIIGILIAAALVWWIYRKIKRKMRQLASTPEVQVLRYVAKHLSEGDLTQPDASKPRSLAGMDRLCLPQIAKDFPEFNWSEWKTQIETELRKKLEREYQKVHIHRTVISRYQKEKGLCRILCESAVEYEKMTEYEKTPEMQSELHSNLIQTVYETELVYVYEDAKTAGAAVSLICPNCGAPIRKLGLKKCEYCGSVLEVQNKKAWRLLEMREK